MSQPLLGARVRRQHDPRLLTGHGAFVDDVSLPGQLHMAVWRSPLAHARIRGVNVDRALAVAGVVDAFDASAFGPSPPEFPVVVGHESLKPCPQYPLAKDRARYVGEGVVVIIAESRAIAEDALDRLDVDLEPLEVLASADAALDPAAPRLHDAASANTCAAWTERLGDVASAFA